MTTPAKLGTQAIGAAGELLVQYRLIKRGIDSARLTTDSGIDLVMYVPGHREALTVQVKPVREPTHRYSAGLGPLIVWWMFPVTCEAQWLAGVDISRDLVWLLPIEDAMRFARGCDSKGQTSLYWYLEDRPRGGKTGVESDFDWYRFEAVIDRLLAGEVTELP